jgi:hypothetical protein
MEFFLEADGQVLLCSALLHAMPTIHPIKMAHLVNERVTAGGLGEDLESQGLCGEVIRQDTCALDSELPCPLCTLKLN